MATTGHESSDPKSRRERVADVRQRAAEMRQRAEEQVDSTAGRVAAVAVARDVARHQRTHIAGPLAGHIAFKLFSWLVPLVLVLVTVTGIAQDHGTDVEDTANTSLGLGQSLARTLRTASEQTHDTRWHLAVIALSGILLATSGLVSALHAAYAQLWGLPAARVTGRGRLLARILGGVPVLVVILVATAALRKNGPIVGFATGLINMGVVAGLLLGLAWIMPRRATDVRWLLPGALAGALAVVGLQLVATYWMPEHISKLSSTYGVFGLALALLAYLALIAKIIVLSISLDVVIYDRYHDDGDQTPLRSQSAASPAGKSASRPTSS